MYKLTMRSNLIPFFLVLAAGIAASIFVPSYLPNMTGEIPAFALFPGEIALALILSVLMYENATPAEFIKIAGVMLIIAFIDGAICNLVGNTTVWMPDSTLRLNWAQVALFNLTGILSVLSFYTSESDSDVSSAVRDTKNLQDAVSTNKKEFDFSPQENLNQEKETSQEIIKQLDTNRIDKLEQSISPEKVSLESLFAEETEAASKNLVVSKPELEKSPVQESTPIQAEPELKAQEEIKVESTIVNEKVETESSEPEGTAESRLFGDVSDDLDNIFADIAPSAQQADFSPAEATLEKAEEHIEKEDSKQAPTNLGPKAGKPEDAAATVKQFGKLAASTGKDQASAGTLKTIGQMLLDSSAVERIIKQADSQEGGSKWKVLTVDRGADLQALMNKIAEHDTVESALLMGKDGLLLGNTDSLSALKYVFGPLSLAMHSTSNLGTSKLQMGELRQMILKSGDSVSILIDVGSAILAVFAKWDLAKIDSLMQWINEATANCAAVSGELPSSQTEFNLSSAGAASTVTPSLPQAETKSTEEITPPQVITPEPEPESKVIESSSSGVLNVSDDDMSGIFDNLLDENSKDKQKEIAQAPQPEQAPAQAPAPAASGVLNVSDDDMSGIFDNLLDESSKDKQKETAQAAQPVQAPAPAAAPATSGVLNVSDDDMSGIFDNLLDESSKDKKSMDFSPADKQKEAAQTEKPVAKAQNSKTGETDKTNKKGKDSKPAAQIKEFGKLSAATSSKQDTGSEQGSMKAIGKQLIDVQAVENIIKSGEKREKIGSGLTTARVISAARGEGIKTLLSKIDTYEGVIGSLIVGHDGLVIASTLQGGIDKDMMGAMCTAIHSHMDVGIKKIERGKLQQAIFFGTDNKVTVMTAVAVGILAVFVDNAGVENIDNLVNTIDSTVRG